MKLKKKSNLSVVIVIAVLLVVSVSVGLLIWINVNKEEDTPVLQEIVISSLPQRKYYVGDSFDATGLTIQVVTENIDHTYFISYPDPDLIVTGFDSSVANDELPITVSYKGFTATFNVVVKEYAPPVPTLVGIEISDNFQTTYDKDYWNDYGPITKDVKLTLVYSDGTLVDDIALKHKYIYGFTTVESAGTTQITIKYSDGVTTVELPITITITN